MRFFVRVLRWFRAEIVLGFLIASVLWAGVLGWQAASVPSNAEKQKCYEAAEKSGHKTEECKSLWERTTSDPVALFTLVLAISTGGLWLATIGLYRAGERQIEFSRQASAAQSRDMQASIAEAKKSADAAMLAIGSDRAWMLLDEPMIMPVEGASIDGVWHDSAFMFAAWWKNMGRSPATNAEIASDHCLIPINSNEPPPFAPRWYSEPGVGSTVGPNTRVRSLPRAIGAQERRLIENGSMAIILFAEIRYRDIFNPGTLHTSTVCLRIEYNGSITDVRTGAQTPRWEITAVGPQNRIT
jgi:hypothetical protein